MRKEWISVGGKEEAGEKGEVEGEGEDRGGSGGAGGELQEGVGRAEQCRVLWDQVGYSDSHSDNDRCSVSSFSSFGLRVCALLTRIRTTKLVTMQIIKETW